MRTYEISLYRGASGLKTRIGSAQKFEAEDIAAAANLAPKLYGEAIAGCDSVKVEGEDGYRWIKGS